MSKKEKVVITLLTLFICFMVTSQCYALNSSRSSHIDPWTNQTEMMPKGISALTSSALGGTFCIKKGGALRYTPESLLEDTEIKGTTIHYNVHCGSYNARNATAILENTRLGVGSAIAARIVSFEYAKANAGSGIWARYGANTRYNIENPESVLYKGYKNATYQTSSDPFTEEQVYKSVCKLTKQNDYIAYLLSSGSWNGASPVHGAFTDGRNLGNYQTSTSDIADAQLIQDAIWTDKGGLNVGNTYIGPQQAKDLLKEAKDYESLVPQLTNYNSQVSFGATTPKVIVNQSEKTYTIGPYVVYYPYDTRFSYIQEIYVINSSGNKVATRVITEDGKNPKSGIKFFLQFSANSVDNPSTVNFKVDFAYLAQTNANYEQYSGSGKIWQYIGYTIERETTHRISYTEECTHLIKDKDGKMVKQHPDGDTKWDDCKEYTLDGYVKKFCVGSYNAQDLIEVKAVSRIWKETTISAPANLQVYLGIELGGIVWEDANGGKENVANGVIDNTEARVPYVTVNLYNQKGGSPIKTTKTDDNGKYKFTGLSAMDKYYVTFTYNGQYYEPTNYTPPSDSTNGWGRGNWSTNSNATDKKTEREAYNKKFENIGSAPANYVVSGQNRETYTKNELLGLTLDADGQYKQTRQAVIDKFGNLILETSGDSTTQKMIQYVKDCQMTAHTGNVNGVHDLYPYLSTFTIDIAGVANSLVPYYGGLYDSAYYINLGLHPRQEADLAIKKDIEKVVLEINGQTQEYTYNTLEDKANADKTWDISVRLSDAYYNTNYSREIYTSDYLYKVSNYGADFAKYGKDKSSELEVYVTYKIMVRNQSLSIQMKVNELVDYYDQDYEYVDARSYIQFVKNGARSSVKMQENSIYGTATETTLKDYNKIYIEGLNGEYLSAGQTAYIYLTFKVKKDINENEAWLKLDENVQSQAAIGVGKENIVEINGYSTKYAPGTKIPNAGDVGGTPAGLIDRDSKPGNINPSDVPKDGTIKYQNLEDDTDKAPNLRLKLYRDDSANRVISGVVWEDERTQTIEATTTGDGIKQDNEKRINGVTVQLVEVMANGTEFVWKTFEEGSGMVASTAPVINSNGIVANYDFPANHAGAYAFKSFIPGKYIVRFIYGDSEKTVLTNTDNNVNQTLGKKGQNEKSYNGQDYKSTIYQSGITQNGTYAWRNNSTWNLGQEVVGGVIKEISSFKAEALQNDKGSYLDATSQNDTGSYLYDITASDTKNNVSDAKDMASERNKVVDYSKGEMTNEKAEVLASFRDLPTYEGKGYTKEEMQKLINELIEKTKMRAETGVIVMEIEYNKKQTGEQVVNNKTSYTVSNVDLGLEERPKAQIAIDKKVTHVKLTLADGTILFDTQGPTTNVLWKEHKPYSNNETLMNPATFGTLANIRKLNTSRVGLIQLSMDEELMHGATIQISYSIRAGNIGEVDYLDNLFYYTGQVKDKTKVVKAKATQVVDYVANNLQFNATDNDNLDWTLTNKDELISQGLINKKLESAVEKYNTILITDKLNEYLVPTVYKEKVDRNAKDTTDSISLVLTQVITPENDTDDLSYRNIVEIVKASNTIGRRNEFSVVGNQDPTLEPQEIDTDRAEVVKILPPFGNAGIYIVIALIVIATSGIVVGGIIFIKKKVLNK